MDKFDVNKDYYAILGANENSSPREIERLYKRLAHKHHPDRGGAEDRMKALNEAYGALRDETQRREYDLQRQKARSADARIAIMPTARDVGVSGQLLSALLCVTLGLLLLFLVRFNGLWFLWPLGILAAGVVLFGVLIAHSAMTNLRETLRESHPARRFRAVQEIVFWSAVCGGGYGVYLIMTTI